MTHLYIEQNTGLTEEVNASIIAKLYELASSGDLDNTSDLKGRLHTTIGYRYQVDYLNNAYSDLHIDATNYAIKFEDPNMLLYLLNKGIGANGMITETQASAVTSVADAPNSTITKFNELKYFTSITLSRGGFEGYSIGDIRFNSWTALEEVDISNLTSLGHNNGSGHEDTFEDCTSLKKVTASNKLTKLGYSAFCNCNNLDTFTGLTGIIEVWDQTFWNCAKLPLSFFQPLSFILKSAGPGCNFKGCTLMTSINIAEGTTTIPTNCFWDCANLATVTFPSTLTTIKDSAFNGCSNLTTIDLTNILHIGGETFRVSGLTGVVNLPSIVSIGDSTRVGTFAFCYNITLVNIGASFNNNTQYMGSCFGDCTSLQSVTGLGNITYIPRYMFNNCTSLTSVDIDWTKITTIGEYAFSNCNSLSISSIVLNPLLTTIPRACFKGCSNLTNIDLSNVEIIGGDWLYGAFLGCTGLTSIDLSNCTSIGDSCFMGCTNLQVSNTQNVTSIGNACFYGCSSITELYMPNLNLTGPTQNNKNNFGNCTLLSKITLGDCVTLGNDFSSTSEWNVYFLNCTSLHTVDVKSLQTVPNNVGDAIFKNCPNMRNFIIRSATVPTVQNNGSTLIKHFGGSSVKIYVPDAAVNDYKNATGWSNVSDYIYPLSQYSAS